MHTREARQRLHGCPVTRHLQLCSLSCCTKSKQQVWQASLFSLRRCLNGCASPAAAALCAADVSINTYLLRNYCFIASPKWCAAGVSMAALRQLPLRSVLLTSSSSTYLPTYFSVESQRGCLTRRCVNGCAAPAAAALCAADVSIKASLLRPTFQWNHKEVV
jgi:hypothetical protein